jgi:hypothetical protein
MTNYKQIISEINRVNELMGTRLITEQRVDKILQGFIDLSNNQKIKTKISNLLAKESLTISDVKTLFNTLKNTKGTNKSILDRISSFEKSIVDKSNSPSSIDKINSGLSKGLDEDEIMNDILLDMRKKYGTFMDDDKILDAFTSNISKKIGELKSIKPNEPKPNEPKPKEPNENLSKTINEISPNFTKFAANKFDKMSKIAKEINENANNLINNQNQLSANEIISLEKSIIKGFNDLYYGNSEIIKFIEKEIEQGLSSNNKNIAKKYKLVKNKLDELKKTLGDDWSVVEVLTPNKGRFRFLRITIGESFKEWRPLIMGFQRFPRVIREVSHKLNEIYNKWKYGNKYEIKTIDPIISKKLEGSGVVPFWDKQFYLTVFGSGRGIPKKSLSKIVDGKVIKLDNPYQNIIDLFPKNKIGMSWASFIIEKLIKIVKTSLYIHVVTEFSVWFKFFFVSDKQLQKKYGNCIDEITRKFKETGKEIHELTSNEYPECFNNLIKDPNINDEVLSDMLIRGYYFADEKGVREHISSVLDSLKLSESFFSFIVSSRAQVITEIIKLINNSLESQRTGDESILDGLIGNLRIELEQAQEESPVGISETPSTTQTSTQQDDSTTTQTTTQQQGSSTTNQTTINPEG